MANIQHPKRSIFKYVEVVDDDGYPTGYHRDTETNEIVTLDDEEEEAADIDAFIENEAWRLSQLPFDTDVALDNEKFAEELLAFGRAIRDADRPGEGERK